MPQVTVDVDSESPPPVQLVFDKVSIEVKTKQGPLKILNEVSGIFGPSESIAVMGPSGSGKTTMLNALTGVQPPTSGTILCNGQPLDQATMRAVSALVPQDDLLTPVLTVRESLLEACTFKTTLSQEDKVKRVETLIEQFDLKVCRDVIVGAPDGKKGISGGQKRRLSVALELAGKPSLLYLDEPTSGLDSVSAMSLVRLMKQLATTGVTVIATIHQPSAEAFFTFDRLLLLARGSICYFGPVSTTQPMAYLASAGFECPPLNNPAEFMFTVLVGSTDVLREKFAAEGVPDDKDRAPGSFPPLSADTRYPISMLRQVLTHMRRERIKMIRDPAMLKLRVGSLIGIGIAIGILYWDQNNELTGMTNRITYTLFIMMFLAVANAIPVVIQVFPELVIGRKEVRNFWYSPNSVVPGKFVVETPILLIPPCAFVLISGFMTNVANSDDGSRFLHLYIAVLMVVMTTHAWALFIVSLAPTLSVAFLAAPGSIMPMAIFSGFFVNQQDMPWVFRWFSYINYLNYSWQALATAVFNGLELNAGLYTSGEQVLKDRLRLPTSDIRGYWTNIGILLCFLLVFRVVATLMIARKLKK